MSVDRKTTILLISALTDAVILMGSNLGAAMIAKGDAMLPSYPVLFLTLVGGIVAFARTVQQGLKKADSETTTITTEVTKPKD